MYGAIQGIPVWEAFRRGKALSRPWLNVIFATPRITRFSVNHDVLRETKPKWLKTKILVSCSAKRKIYFRDLVIIPRHSDVPLMPMEQL